MDTERRKKASEYGKRSYQARLERLGLERIQEIARENAKNRKRRPAKKKIPRAMKW